MELIFEKFKYPQELPDQRKLFVECFPENMGTPVESADHYNWKFHAFPSSMKEKSYEYVAKLGTDLIGYYAALPYQYQVSGSLVQAAMVCDVMTGIQARGKGVFTKLGVYATEEFKNEGFAFSTGFPIRADVIPGHKKAGWSFPFEIPMYGKFLKMNQFLKARKLSLLTPFANAGIFICNAFANLLSYKSKKGFVVEMYRSTQVNEIAGLDEFLAQWNKEQEIALTKNTHFLNWRLSAPGKAYYILKINTGEKMVGYTVFRPVEKEGVHCIGVLDFCMLADFRSASPLLMRKITEIAKKEQAELILMMMMKNNASKYQLKKQGFIKTPFPFSFIIKIFNNTPNQDVLLNEDNWSLMWIDSDDL